VRGEGEEEENESVLRSGTEDYTLPTTVHINEEGQHSHGVQSQFCMDCMDFFEPIDNDVPINDVILEDFSGHSPMQSGSESIASASAGGEETVDHNEADPSIQYETDNYYETDHTTHHTDTFDETVESAGLTFETVTSIDTKTNRRVTFSFSDTHYSDFDDDDEILSY